MPARKKPVARKRSSPKAVFKPARTEEEFNNSTFWRELGLPEPKFRDESLAPALDRPLLRKLLDDELVEGDQRLVYRLIDSFKSWNQAYHKMVLAKCPWKSRKKLPRGVSRRRARPESRRRA